jgi:hypothetical protein
MYPRKGGGGNPVILSPKKQTTACLLISMIGGLIIRLDMVAEFSFLLALPTLGAATLYSDYKHWHVLSDSVGIAALAPHFSIKLCTCNTKDFDPQKHSFVEIPYTL